MMPENITLTELDYFRINSLLEQNEPELELLENEIEKARIVDFPEIPSNLITMYTKFRYLNVTENKVGEMTIVYPLHANSAENKVSVTAPLGTALIGLSEDDEIDWTFPNGQTKRLKVLDIIYQPESNGDLHL